MSINKRTDNQPKSVGFESSNSYDKLKFYFHCHPVLLLLAIIVTPSIHSKLIVLNQILKFSADMIELAFQIGKDYLNLYDNF